MQVWIVQRGVRYEGRSVVMVCGTREKALEVVEELIESHTNPTWKQAGNTDRWESWWGKELGSDYLVIEQMEVR